jgi:nitrogen-specific signal transduction histidine kinase
MQAPLSSTASGKLFRPGTLTAPPPATPPTTLDCHERPLGSLIGLSGFSHTYPYNSVAEGTGLAHDAGNLLGALGLYCELLALPGVLREEHRHYAEELQLLSGRSRELIDRLLNPATTGRYAAWRESERVVVPDVIEGCRGVLNSVAQRAVTVAYGTGTALPVAVSRESLERILVNLTKNAAEATPQTTGRAGDAAITLRVTCHRDGTQPARIVLAIEDKGSGMSTAAVKVLLGESVPAAARPIASRPRGIGFQVVRELVGASGGQLRLTSRIGSGTTVSIAWAIADEESGRAIAEATNDSMVNPLEERRRLMATALKGRTGRLSC